MTFFSLNMNYFRMSISIESFMLTSMDGLLEMTLTWVRDRQKRVGLKAVRKFEASSLLPSQMHLHTTVPRLLLRPLHARPSSVRCLRMPAM